MIKASVYVICQDEQKHIERMLKSVADFEEIIVVDSGSKDKTLQIARKFTDKIYHHDWQGEGAQKDYAFSLCKNEWVLNLDADEEITSELKTEIENFMEQSDFDALDIKFHEYSLGSVCSPLVRKNTHIRFFRKSCGKYLNLGVHAQISIHGKVAKSKHSIHHFSDKFIKELVMKNNNYSSLRAKSDFEKGKKPNFLKLIFIFPLVFFKSYILRRSFFDGKKGFITSTINAFYAFLKEAKLYEINLKNKK
ncbi:glycosyltransferase family 2 protein [Campylobacter hyointestinalis]|uniref:glycosyltransferase family 2 protein n=1 Tax=Campylobacter hyointestinalis TaxID=198 RepID=UPI00072BE6A1|nr:glycosyltransferase family 2 protein [Campylobacter hyointestinalis]ANE33870.1 glycosyltransferase, family 2 [Campylobacter hyointestinalis subsp. lawsonii CCUG 27631]PPB61783.1 glycosyl transferase [Campylobacter hyointestinalis subsp. hyointestinalis]PPB65991.1 glycosyl transferase [Campylobacter hyointestinalis subsp. hyointestinalis]PPB68982.1 glycosyl transferase [Campylobacter hyointestinalis subsp. hyointestinalis]RAZ54363.1 glycosyltransferase family 2 protein [Campylobacter hyointe